MKKILFVVALCLGPAIFLQAQQSFRFDHITGKDGLSQSQAYSMLHDSRGYLWIGTQDGLNRYDGHEFKVFKNDPFDSTTLTHNWIWSVEEDRHGDLWIGTFQGLCKYVRNENRFIQYYNKLHDSTSIGGNRTNNVIRDKKGRIWISAWGGGLSLYNEKSNSFTQFRRDETNGQSLSDDNVRTLFCDRDGDIWVGTWTGGLNKVVEDENGFHFQRFYLAETNTFAGGNQITTITEDSEGGILIGGYSSGIVRYNKVDKTFTRVPNFLPQDVNRILCDRQGNWWVGTNNGLVYYDVKIKSFQRYTHQPTVSSSISSNTIYAIKQDRQGIVWIAGSGLDKYDPTKNVFQLYRNDPENLNSLQENIVFSFCEDGDKKIWIGTDSGPVNIFDPRTHQFEAVTIADDQGNLATNVQAIAHKDDIMWFASFTSGLVRYEKKTRRAKFYLNNHPSILGKTPFVKELLFDNDGTLWIGTYDRGLVNLNTTTDEATTYQASMTDSHAIGSNYTNALYQDKGGDIWIGLMGGGLSVFHKATQDFTHYKYDRKNINSLSDQMVSSIHQQNDSIFWIGTHSGLNRLNVNTGNFDHYFEKDGLANNVSYEILEDNEHHLWISTDGGLSEFNPRKKTFRTYTEQDGLPNNEFNANAVLKSSSGDFYFGTIRGFTVFNPAHVPESTTAPTLVIQGYAVFNKFFMPQQDLSLTFDQNYLTFKFAALEFSSPEKIKYAYKLDGVDKQWTTGNSREAHYTNLDPGRYTFRVKAANAGGYWTEPGTSMAFVIHPPFWKTWWFTGLMVIVSAIIIYAVHRYRLEQSLKVERLRNKIASDLHDEVGSSLTRISIYSDLVQNGTEEKENKSYLKGISELSREVVLTMSDIVWSIDNRYDTLEALILRMKDFATELLQAKNIDFVFDVAGMDGKKILDPALKQNLYLIFKEAINNIVKHAHASHVHIAITKSKGEFLMVIQDNGTGVIDERSGKGNGLRNMKRRAEAIAGTFSIESTNGTTISLTTRQV